MIFNCKKKQAEQLKASFGKLKDESFSFELIEKYFRNKDHSESLQMLSDKTCNDLDFDELFMFLDRTNSKIGQQYLYNKLREIPSDSKHLELDEELITQFASDSDFRLEIQAELTKLDQRETYYISTLFQEGYLEQPKWFFVMRLLSFTSILSVLLLPFNLKLVFVLIGVFIINICFHLWNKKNLSSYSGSISQLLILKRVANHLFQHENLKKINPILTESIKVIDQVRNSMLIFKLESKIEGDFQVILWSLLELIKILFLLEPLLLFGVLKRLDTRREEVEKVYSFVGRVDALVSIASLRVGAEVNCIPEICEENSRIIGDQIYHPLIFDCVTNQIVVNDKSVLLTGSNMSGKTTFIRAIGINVITGLTINTCFAKSMAIPRARIHSAIRISDDLMNDKSYYFEEVLTIKDMIDNAGKGTANLFLLDEIFKGTNTIERISAGKAVLSSLAKNENIVFVSTHDIELTDLLEDEYELYHFSEIVSDKSVDFDYKLKEGKLKNRNAIRILQINGYPDEIIEEAIALAEELDRNKVLES
ncbi:MutS-related protein [Labilibaculum antarcticum]|uniref:DNA mismatch repair protein MutS n=1 Tax=Labilibaculum antarcticum TaxID=1717717 RepID=A0A1Y1CNY9_9BACT|nr:DNA mismatch repair protein MutS [Labilibaculum antarcticum]BAX81984.1 DNA mismatch repair protein MutS [Labilibaculum antarcticum]